ncbi:MAG: PQQ-binding-like beta-propeller repeat protein [Actinomycetaceae bacterium]|nr:PQQ-binding-like beta-propeller repeat protein [Actinomycetaceae bacterium]MDU0970861.1 PQQ-binding-like beta-propeller repeat protein [Actinomycetaceae bacterium]
MAGSKKRVVTRIISVIVILAVIALTVWVAARYVRDKHSEGGQVSVGAFAKEPNLAQSYTPKTYGMSAFVPVLGTGNSTGPVSYGDKSIMAGTTKAGATIIMAVGQDGRALWQTSLKGPLIACSHAPDDTLLPCLVKSSTGTLVATVDLQTGAAHWIMEDNQNYINVGVNGNNEIILLGDDLSLTRISTDGVLLGEPMLSQDASDQTLVPDASGCSLGAATTTVPETFQQLSSTMYLISHNGLNTFVNSANNKIVGQIPGALLTTPGDASGRWVVAPIDGCTRAATVTPGRNRIHMLPQGITVPIPPNHTIPEVVLRKGKFFAMNWSTPLIGQQQYEALTETIDGSPLFLATDKVIVLADKKSATAFSKTSGQRLWHVSERVHDLGVVDDVAVLDSDDGGVRGIGLYSGKDQWTLPDNALGTMTTPDEKSLTIYSQTGWFTWQAQTRKSGSTESPQQGQAATVGQINPGITYATSGCIRVTKTDGSDRDYKATTQRVDCSLEGAEPIAGLISTDTVARGKSGNDYLKACTDRFPDSISAITVTSPRTDQSISAICTGNPHASSDQ